jgi:uncharacterized metal-binding protein
MLSGEAAALLVCLIRCDNQPQEEQHCLFASRTIYVCVGCSYAAQTGQRVTSLDELQDIDELCVTEASGSQSADTAWNNTMGMEQSTCFQ